MTNTVRWFDRKFEFTFPAAVSAAILERLRSAPDRLDAILSSTPADVLIRRVDDTWSMQENAGHLLDLEPLWAMRLDDFLAGKERLSPADLTNRRTHEANHNAARAADLSAAFRAARLTFVQRLGELDAAAFERVSKHPRLEQTMRLVDHMYFVAEHDDHHLARMAELRRRLVT